MKQWHDDWDWFEDDDDDDRDPLEYEDYDFEDWLEDCGLTEENICLEAGTEYCSFVCPFSALMYHNSDKDAVKVTEFTEAKITKGNRL